MAALKKNIATARALKPLAGSQTLVPDPDCNWPIRAALLRLIPVLCFRQPHPRAGDQGGTGSAMPEEGAPYYWNGLAWMLEECWNEVISFGFILQGSCDTPRSSPPPLGHLDPSHRFRSPSNHGLSKPGHIS
ncbi:hypothetical protein BO79DRAFT_239413 [Aspergillus costaricaensis CBS 115574]|uniref:Uncharacterized protein n=1 Tax=Aspergillus costaricaensis CBS 115574 TaxID=1448317 RepID=A0ACD1I6K0_9EURO|nr:hypothetical protein BO79DRAFT_239413 [Aspergillus costaricaensis CBS 115574]RAK86129.1 hypothetical protein BO79DRAFT_239413 [Aspergillus costaricaensis CBS 115574]